MFLWLAFFSFSFLKGNKLFSALIHISALLHRAAYGCGRLQQHMPMPTVSENRQLINWIHFGWNFVFLLVWCTYIRALVTVSFKMKWNEAQRIWRWQMILVALFIHFVALIMLWARKLAFDGGWCNLQTKWNSHAWKM